MNRVFASEFEGVLLRKIGCFGLVNSQLQKYMTAESFAYTLNANGSSLKQKQLWMLECTAEGITFLRSHLNKYLSVDLLGNVRCDNDTPDSAGRFEINFNWNGTSRWAIKNISRGSFLGATPDNLICDATEPGPSELWIVHLAVRPQITLYSIGRKRFAHLSESHEEVQVDANMPWGEGSLFTLEFRLEDGGRYALRTYNNKYLNCKGELQQIRNEMCLFNAEYNGGSVAFRDKDGLCLSPMGPTAALKSVSFQITSNELFSLVHPLPQVCFLARLNSRYVSVKQGVDVTANQEKVGADETFQLEYEPTDGSWAVRTMQNRYWSLSVGDAIQATSERSCSQDLFHIVWHADGSLSFSAKNGKFLSTKHSGHLYAVAEAVTDVMKFHFYFTNRSFLMLKCDQGYVGYRASASSTLEYNKTAPEPLVIERGEKGLMYLKGHDGHYLRVNDDVICVDVNAPIDGFYLELTNMNKIRVKTQDGKYWFAGSGAIVKLLEDDGDAATVWEY